MRLLSDKQLNIKIGNKSFLYILLSFLFPFFIIFVALFFLGIVPFGIHSLAVSDGNAYVRVFTHFSRILHGQENILYSFKNGLGGNEWSLLAWGGITPVVLLAFFATPETMPVFFTWITVIDICICGVTMYILLSNTRGHLFTNLIFSTSYALMGFNVAYCYHYLFFIGPQFLPLVALGLRRMFKGKSPLVYIISLSLSIFLNFYFGFILCVASIVMLGVYLYTSECRKKEVFVRWFISSLLSGIIAAPMWLPAIKAYSGGGRLDQAFESGISFDDNISLIRVFSKFFSGANSYIEQSAGLPFIFCGILVVALVILFFLNRNIQIRQRRAAGCVLAFYLLTFCISILTRLMHGGTHTNWFNYRYSFVFTFFMIMLAAEEFSYIDKLPWEDINKCGAIILISTIIIFSESYEFNNSGLVIVDLAWLWHTKIKY